MTRKLVPLILILPLLTSCFNSKRLAYFQDLSDTTKIYKVDMFPYEPIRLQPNDQVQVNISSFSQNLSQFFNLPAGSPTTMVGGMMSGTGNQAANNYLINREGFIILPVLGEVQAAGLTTDELRLKIKDMLKDYIKDPVVIVTLSNFRITVLGEVGNRVVPVQGERINMLEVLGVSGDMTVYGKRYNVKVMRRVGDSYEVAHLNFNHSRAIRSPYFQVRPNDVIYVEPRRAKGFTSEGWVFILPWITTLAFFLQWLIQTVF